MFFFFPFYGGGGFFFLLLLLLVARVLRNLFRNNNSSDDYTHYYYYNFSNGQGNANSNTANTGSTCSTADSYKVLGITPQATETEIKKAYRKLILEYHPDTVAAKEGLSEESKKYATRKFREVQEAYEQICRERGIK